jgi:aminoglycoside/choline kinase family phosphotransferase
MSDFRERLELFLRARGLAATIEQLTPDASTREYFRIRERLGTAIACVYPESFVAAEQSYPDVTGLFLRCGLPVAKILDHDEELGVILLEDFGDRILRDEMEVSSPEKREELIDRAIALIPRIQAATQTARATNSIAARLSFDVEKLMWELEFFKTHYFTTLRKRPLSPDKDARLTAEFLDVSQQLEDRATVLCHRDFHAANIMLDSDGELRIIDHQDARIGSPAYDLVSLLLDRVTVLPTPEWLAQKRRLFLEGRSSVGLPLISESDFASEFRLQTVQRCLKAAGTFSYQSATRGKTYFTPFIMPMFRIVLRAIENIGGYPTLREVLSNELAADQAR